MKAALGALLLNGLVSLDPTVLVASGHREPGPEDRECRYRFEENAMVCETKAGETRRWAYAIPGPTGFNRRKNFDRWVLSRRNCWLMKQNVNGRRDEFVSFEPRACPDGSRGSLANPDPFDPKPDP